MKFKDAPKDKWFGGFDVFIKKEDSRGHKLSGKEGPYFGREEDVFICRKFGDIEDGTIIYSEYKFYVKSSDSSAIRNGVTVEFEMDEEVWSL